MNRRHFLASSSSAIIAAAVREWPALAQGREARPVTKFTDLRGGTGIFTGRGGTIGWLVTDEGAVVVDSQVPNTAQTCVDGIKQRSRRGIHVLLNTHHHADHTAGNKTFRPAAKFIVAHANSADWQQKSAVGAKERVSLRTLVMLSEDMASGFRGRARVFVHGYPNGGGGQEAANRRAP